jgi:hypothetical protein
LVAFCAVCVAAAARHFPEPPMQWLVAGGGRRNPALMKALGGALEEPVRPVEVAGWDGDALEAQAFGVLGARVARGLPLSVPSTTGAPRPLTGGRTATPPEPRPPTPSWDLPECPPRPPGPAPAPRARGRSRVRVRGRGRGRGRRGGVFPKTTLDFLDSLHTRPDPTRPRPRSPIFISYPPTRPPQTRPHTGEWRRAVLGAFHIGSSRVEPNLCKITQEHPICLFHSMPCDLQDQTCLSSDGICYHVNYPNGLSIHTCIPSYVVCEGIIHPRVQASAQVNVSRGCK